MNKRYLLLAVPLICFFLKINAFSHGLGVKAEYDFYLGSQTNLISVGLIYDSNLATTKTMNFRVNIDYGLLKIYENKPIWAPMDYLLNFRVLFGFGLYTNSWSRIYLGPQIGVSIFIPNPLGSGINNPASIYSMMPIGVPIGVVLGYNINIGKNFTISLEAGYNIDVVSVVGALMTATANSYMNSYSTTSTSNSTYVLRHNVFGGVSFMFRFSGDNYEKPKNIENPILDEEKKNEKKDENINYI